MGADRRSRPHLRRRHTRGLDRDEGTWWPAGYAGEPLVSFEAELARTGPKIGDSVTVNVLGRNLTARVANLREVKWESLASTS